jgi:hypothetical protein
MRTTDENRVASLIRRSGGEKGLVKDSACVVVFGQGPAAGLLDFARASRGYLDAPA